MIRTSAILLAFALLAGCGAEVAGTAAVGGAIKAEELRQANQTKQQVQQRLDAAMQNLQQRQAGAEAASQ
jgi:outer membrane lipopolysaccharide assembly protein LptE/RlpB